MPIVTSGTDHHFDLTMVWDNLGGAVRVRRNGLAQVIDPSAGTPVTVEQDGQPTTVVRSDNNGRVTFVAQQGIVNLVADGLVSRAISAEQATAGADNAALAQTAQAGAEAARDEAQAAADSAASLKTQLDAVQSTVPTIDELVQTVVISTWGTAGSTVENGPVTHTVWIAPFDCSITWAAMSFDYWTLAESDSNYWQFQFTRGRGADRANIVSKTTMSTGSGGEGITARTFWGFSGFVWDTNAAKMQAGDLLLLRTAKTGSPADVQLPMTVTFRYVPA